MTAFILYTSLPKGSRHKSSGSGEHVNPLGHFPQNVFLLFIGEKYNRQNLHMNEDSVFLM